VNRYPPFIRSSAACLVLSLGFGVIAGCGGEKGSGVEGEKVPEGIEKLKESMKERMSGKAGRPGAQKGARGR